MGSQLFADETKQRGYQLVVVTVETADGAEDLRKVMRGLVLKGQRRVHMKKERDSRRRAIAAAICGSRVRAVVYDAGRRYPHELDARAGCLRAVVFDAAPLASLLVLERDDSLIGWDNQRLIELTRAAGCRETLQYRHVRAESEVLLSIPDAIAWCWAKSGEWRRRIEPVVSEVREV